MEEAPGMEHDKFGMENAEAEFHLAQATEAESKHFTAEQQLGRWSQLPLLHSQHSSPSLSSCEPYRIHLTNMRWERLFTNKDNDDEASELRPAANDHEARGSDMGVIYIFDDDEEKYLWALSAQSKVLVLAWIGVAGLCFHVALTYLLVTVLGWGTPGAAAAYDLSLWAIALGQAAYIIGWCKDGWRGWSMAAFHDMWAFVKLSLESAVMLCLEIWYLGMITVLTGNLQDAQIAVDSLGVCVRVSNELGSGRPRAAMHAVVVVIAESLLIGLLCMALVLIFIDNFAIIYTTDLELQHAVSKIAGLLGLTMVLNSVQPVVSGTGLLLEEDGKI
ncbi:unnamed protein product [Triticum turgidum subsp. durum]|uniref:Protein DETOXIFICATION n=1 Tax=Triticum turgidum subsp. durum TaxID=4567 RepID=A0A9R0Z6L0_TRITD|nr:unnamed protein product [Triticum turgidum subsp. durum]